jgi:hypothetical protein
MVTMVLDHDYHPQYGGGDGNRQEQWKNLSRSCELLGREKEADAADQHCQNQSPNQLHW